MGRRGASHVRKGAAKYVKWHTSGRPGCASSQPHQNETGCHEMPKSLCEVAEPCAQTPAQRLSIGVIAFRLDSHTHSIYAMLTHIFHLCEPHCSCLNRRSGLRTSGPLLCTPLIISRHPPSPAYPPPNELATPPSLFLPRAS